MEKTIEIPFGAKDSELKGWEYTIPEGMEAEIKDGKIIVKQKESEDERIIKAISYAICEATHRDGTLINDVTRDEAVAYLERQKGIVMHTPRYAPPEQKEQKPVQDREEREYVRTLKSLIADFLRDKEDVNRGYYQDINDWLEGRHIEQKLSTAEDIAAAYQMGLAEGRKEQKPAEWSEEDEKNLKLAYDLLVNGVEADRRYPELISWLKSLPKRLHLQPKQGWSETDKQMLENIIEVIGETCPGNYTASFITKMLSWLKSLRPQPHWKPSEDGGTEKHPWNDEDVEKAYREGMKAGAEWQREQYECIPAEEEYMRGFAQGAKEERKDLTPLINRLCEAILFEWKDAADLARKTLTQIKEREEK